MKLDEKLKNEIKEIFKNKNLSDENILDIKNIIKSELAKERRPVA